jgi:hypothetical protein
MPNEYQMTIEEEFRGKWHDARLVHDIETLDPFMHYMNLKALSNQAKRQYDDVKTSADIVFLASVKKAWEEYKAYNGDPRRTYERILYSDSRIKQERRKNNEHSSKE